MNFGIILMMARQKIFNNGFISKRSGLLALMLLFLAVLWPGSAAHAGRQLEEPLADSVRSALSASIANSAPPRPIFEDIQDRINYLKWLADMSSRLRKRKADHTTRVEFLETVWYESRRAGLDPSLVLGLIQVESAFRKYAVSHVGARGYMQVMPFWTRVIGDGDADRLFHMQTNLRFGCVILRHYLDREKGNLFMALGRYNGSRGRSEYPQMVFAAQRSWTNPAADRSEPLTGKTALIR